MAKVRDGSGDDRDPKSTSTSDQAAGPRRREVYKACDIPEEFLAEIMRSRLPAEGRAFDHEVDEVAPE